MTTRLLYTTHWFASRLAHTLPYGSSARSRTLPHGVHTVEEREGRKDERKKDSTYRCVCRHLARTVCPHLRLVIPTFGYHAGHLPHSLHTCHLRRRKKVAPFGCLPLHRTPLRCRHGSLPLHPLLRADLCLTAPARRWRRMPCLHACTALPFHLRTSFHSFAAHSRVTPHRTTCRVTTSRTAHCVWRSSPFTRLLRTLITAHVHLPRRIYTHLCSYPHRATYLLCYCTQFSHLFCWLPLFCCLSLKEEKEDAHPHSPHHTSHLLPLTFPLSSQNIPHTHCTHLFTITHLPQTPLWFFSHTTHLLCHIWPPFGSCLAPLSHTLLLPFSVQNFWLVTYAARCSAHYTAATAATHALPRTPPALLFYIYAFTTAATHLPLPPARGYLRHALLPHHPSPVHYAYRLFCTSCLPPASIVVIGCRCTAYRTYLRLPPQPALSLRRHNGYWRADHCARASSGSPKHALLYATLATAQPHYHITRTSYKHIGLYATQREPRSALVTPLLPRALPIAAPLISHCGKYTLCTRFLAY